MCAVIIGTAGHIDHGKTTLLKALTGINTDRLEEEAYQYFRRIEERGGVKTAIEDGFFVLEIADAAERSQRESDTGERVTVGVNEYVSDEETRIPILKIDAQGERHHLERLKYLECLLYFLDIMINNSKG